MQPRVLVPVADGSEEMETVTVIDVLRRAEAEVVVASVTGRLDLACSRGVRLVADTLLEDTSDQRFDLIVLPGGMPGAEGLRDSAPLTAVLRHHADAGRPYAAICAAPAVVLHHHGLLTDRRATCHPAFFARLDPDTRREDRVVVDGPVITSRGPGTALEFALVLVETLFGAEKRAEVGGPMLAVG
jgi:4-methyl-5(b-hydroxyethyl)-thiazole monophosphate biosynthesis